jgi:phytoene synthase
MDEGSAVEVLQRHGKTFRYAQRFLGRRRGGAIARLYRFCRYIDDLADEHGDVEVSRRKLGSLLGELDNRSAHDPIVRDFLVLADQWGIDLRRGKELVRGVMGDLDTVTIADEPELIRYCFHVAGTVGLMMCPLLGAAPSGMPFAVDLGIGMQLTNIARDVHADAVQQRRYLPGQWVEEISAEKIVSAGAKERILVIDGIRRLLDLAEVYYASGMNGLAYLPPRSRISIAVAATTYREIGVKLRRHGCKWWQGRVSTTGLEKTRLAAITACSQVLLLHRPPPVHDRSLHRYIDDLVNPS